MVLGDSDWQDCGSYWLHLHPQLSPLWIKERKFRLTATNFSAIANPSFYRGADDVVKSYQGLATISSAQDQLASNHGLVNESKARAWYEKRYNCHVKEVGLAVPKWNPQIGASLDGEVEGSNGVIEIKCPARMYGPINKHLSKRETFPRGYHDHIFASHYDQMQGGMAVAEKDWCDYIVFCLATEEVFVDRVYFNREYWEGHVYPKIKEFLETHDSLFKSLKDKYE